jgi:hypothetical protein
MTIEAVTCGRCGDRVPLDVDHAEVRLSVKHMDDRNQRDNYVLCLDCTIEVREEWEHPV